ncbi:hypothetical protein RH915_09210 [Serpentinicella sp. ANB-PHB4]|uniref:hypothetical protein n=1 Tax=Serpentinicella sp. ANB-PHB4 TaxID=3074076 RepID=UPI002864F319|nr:hypothetical protein [Serpentinicella sp. ANB-PHB4]MDR5659673.1 hypothetical protein [Serpentinicella sp. ANB-PHB4]
MSLFLGKIHYWLYNKILKFEAIEKDIVDWSRQEGLPVDEWLKSDYKIYEKPLEGEPLENIINTGNIHGWLQQKISQSELRQADLITKILNKDNNYERNLTDIFIKHGQLSAKDFDGESPDSPEMMYNMLNDIMLEGMPCDRPSTVIKNDDKAFTWETTVCLHKRYWDQVGGNVEMFYKLRGHWVKAFIETLNPNYKYEKIKPYVQSIVEV